MSQYAGRGGLYTVDIPIAAGKHIAEEYGYDQVVIVARKVGGREHVTTYGVNAEHCGVAARMGDFFKHKLMGWPIKEPPVAWLRWDWDCTGQRHLQFEPPPDELPLVDVARAVRYYPLGFIGKTPPSK